MYSQSHSHFSPNLEPIAVQGCREAGPNGREAAQLVVFEQWAEHRPDLKASTFTHGEVGK